MNGLRRSCAIACFVLSACSRRDTPAPAPELASAPAPESAIEPEPAAELDPRYLTADVVAAKSIGHTSFVLKLRLEGDLEAVFKPRSHKAFGTTRFKAEIAAYRLARALGLKNVPVAVPRSFDAANLRAAMRDASFDKFAAPTPDGLLPGALMPWIAGYQVLPLESEPWRSRWQGWLTGGEAPSADEDRALAAQISTMIVFDYMTANWDRWSGANVAVDHASGTLLFVDNDGAFYEAPPQVTLAGQLALVARVRRFSGDFITRLRVLDRARIAGAIGDVLAPNLLDAVEGRRREVVRVIEDRIASDGEASVLSF
jgi:hypothetical protein